VALKNQARPCSLLLNIIAEPSAYFVDLDPIQNIFPPFFLLPKKRFLICQRAVLVYATASLLARSGS